MWGATRNHRSDFDLIAVVEHLVFGHEIVAFDHEMRFDNEIQLPQEFFDLLGAFDFDGSGWMAQLNLHATILSFHVCRGQGVAFVRREGLGVNVINISPYASRFTPYGPSDRRLSQKFCRFFRRHRIDVKPCAPFEAGDLRELGNDFDVPMVEIPGFFVEGRTMENEIVGGLCEDLIHPSQRFRKNRRKELELCFLALFEVAGVSLRENPHFEGKAWSIGSDAEELEILRHDAIAVREVLPENIAVDTAFFLLIMGPAPVDFLEYAGRDDREGDKLRVAVFQCGAG